MLKKGTHAKKLPHGFIYIDRALTEQRLNLVHDRGIGSSPLAQVFARWGKCCEMIQPHNYVFLVTTVEEWLTMRLQTTSLTVDSLQGKSSRTQSLFLISHALRWHTPGRAARFSFRSSVTVAKHGDISLQKNFICIRC